MAASLYQCKLCGLILNLKKARFCCDHAMVQMPGAVKKNLVPPALRDPVRQQCVHLGEEIDRIQCKSCKGNVSVKVFKCDQFGKCTLTNAMGMACCATCPDYNPAPRWISNADLCRDALSLVPRLPLDLAGIVGVPRSGMLPAAILATHLHLPLFTLRGLPGPGSIEPIGHGWRLSDGSGVRGQGPLLVIDDTSYGGNTSKMVREQWRNLCDGRELIFSAVYTTPQRYHRRGPMPDLAALVVEPPHFLEWNFFNSTYVPQTAFDFDGIFTLDGTIEPLHLPRKWPVELIVTGRLERDRLASEAWLRQHGVNFKRLIMYPGALADRDQPGAIARYKSEHFQASGLNWFVESDADQAAQIAKLCRKHVICPTVGKVFSP